MARHIVLNTNAFMGDHTVVNPVPPFGHRIVAQGNSVNPPPTKGNRTAENFKPANPHSPTNGPPAQTTTVSLPSVPVKSGSGNPVGVIK